MVLKLMFRFVACVLLAGCSIMPGPSSDSQEFLDEVYLVVPENELELARYAQWLPNQYGYNNYGGYGKQAGIANRGVFVLSADEVVFLISPDVTGYSYFKALQIPIDSIDTVVVADGFAYAGGRAQRLVIVSERGIDSFEIFNVHKSALDKEIINEVARRLQKQL